MIVSVCSVFCLVFFLCVRGGGGGIHCICSFFSHFCYVVVGVPEVLVILCRLCSCLPPHLPT